MIYAEVLHVFSSTWMLGIISDHQARPLTREEVALAADRLNKPSSTATTDAAGPQVTEAAIQRARERALPWIKEGTDRAELSSTQLIQALYSHEHAAVEAAIAESRKQAKLGWERAAEKDAYYGEMIGQRDALRAQLATRAYLIKIADAQREVAEAQLAAKTAEVERVQGLLNKLETMAREAGIAINAVEGTCLIDFERGGYPTITTDSLADAIAQTKGKTP